MTNQSNVVGIKANAPVRVDSEQATGFRLVKYHGEIYLQGLFPWHQGNEYGAEWKVIPTIDLG